MVFGPADLKKRTFQYVTNLTAASLVLFGMIVLTEVVFDFIDWPSVYAHQPHLKTTHSNIEFKYEFKTNGQGLRNKEIPIKRSYPGTRIYVAGDSFVEGVGVTGPETFVSRLEERFNSEERRVEFINGGLQGAGPKEYLNAFLNIGLQYDPDGLLICLYTNDLTNTHEQGSFSPKRWVYDKFPRISWLVRSFRDRLRSVVGGKESIVDKVTGEAVRRGIDTEKIKAWRSRIPQDLFEAADRGEFNSSLLSNGLLNPTYWTDSLDIDNDVAESKWRRMLEIVSDAVRECRHKGIKVAVVYQPTALQYVAAFHDKDHPWVLSGIRMRYEWLTEETELERRLASWAASEKIPFLNLTKFLRELSLGGDELVYLKDGHWNSEGYRQAARLIGDWLKKERIFFE